MTSNQHLFKRAKDMDLRTLCIYYFKHDEAYAGQGRQIYRQV